MNIFSNQATKPKKIYLVMHITNEGHETAWRAFKYKCEAIKECRCLTEVESCWIEEVMLY